AGPVWETKSRSLALLDPLAEPGAGVRPGAVRYPGGQPQRGCGLGAGQPGEVAQLDQLGGHLVRPTQEGERLVEGQQLVGQLRGCDPVIEQLLADGDAAPLGRGLAAGAFAPPPPP